MKIGIKHYCPSDLESRILNTYHVIDTKDLWLAHGSGIDTQNIAILIDQMEKGGETCIFLKNVCYEALQPDGAHITGKCYWSSDKTWRDWTASYEDVSWIKNWIPKPEEGR